MGVYFLAWPVKTDGSDIISSIEDYGVHIHSCVFCQFFDLENSAAKAIKKALNYSFDFYFKADSVEDLELTFNPAVVKKEVGDIIKLLKKQPNLIPKVPTLLANGNEMDYFSGYKGEFEVMVKQTLSNVEIKPRADSTVTEKNIEESKLAIIDVHKSLFIASIFSEGEKLEPWEQELQNNFNKTKQAIIKMSLTEVRKEYGKFLFFQKLEDSEEDVDLYKDGNIVLYSKLSPSGEPIDKVVIKQG